MKKVVKILIFASVALWVQTNPLNMTTAQVVKDMGLGINGTTVNAYETAWGSPTITEAIIDGYANTGFKTVRIPVAWIKEKFPIDSAECMNRYKKIVVR